MWTCGNLCSVHTNDDDDDSGGSTVVNGTGKPDPANKKDESVQ